ncbi:MAG TPA: hypothetical protein VHA33_19675 [Candidatus Angelobacter sp.]|jgi:hypothetical protein|nr:hypothetical protein [Candidatus Angelobacter sp.]
MKFRFILTFVLLWRVDAGADDLREAWKIDLHHQYQYQTFDRELARNWLSQQGVVFLTPQQIAVYQVSKRPRSAKLGARDTSGGAGNFFLDVKIFDAHDGSLIQSLHLPTSATFSKVFPTHDGKFIVRTGERLCLYSSDFQELASRDLPLKRSAPLEEWEVNVDRSGQFVVLAHQTLFLHEQNSEEGDLNSGKSSADIEILEADTLRTVKTLTVSNYMSHWSVGDHFLVGNHYTVPSHVNDFGRMDYDGRWTELNSLWKVPRNSCSYLMDGMAHEFVAVYGCNRLFLLAPGGEKVFSAKVAADETIASVINADSYLAAESDRNEIKFGNTVARPVRIELYDVRRKTTLKWVPISSGAVYYDVSTNGDLAVIDGRELTLYVKEP